MGEGGRQGLLGKWCEIKRHGFALAIDEGEAVLLLGDFVGDDEPLEEVLGRPLGVAFRPALRREMAPFLPR